MLLILPYSVTHQKTLLTYGSERWTVQQLQARELSTFQQRHLRIILGIKWNDFVCNEEVIRRANLEDIEIKLVRSRLRWLGHHCHIGDDRPAKRLLYSEPVNGSRPVGRPKLRFKDTLKTTVKCGNVLDVWQHSAHDRGKLLRRVFTDHTALKGLQLIKDSEKPVEEEE